MSYSFSVGAPTLALALIAANAEYDRIVQYDPVHAKDREAAFKTVDNAAAVITFDPEKDVYISMSGSLSWDYAGGTPPESFTGCNIGLVIGQTARTTHVQV